MIIFSITGIRVSLLVIPGDIENKYLDYYPSFMFNKMKLIGNENALLLKNTEGVENEFVSFNGRVLSLEDM